MADLVVQMRGGGCTGVAGIAEQLASFDVAANADFNAVHVAVNSGEPVVVNQPDHVAQAAVVVF
jgi:hypothetical protein